MGFGLRPTGNREGTANVRTSQTPSRHPPTPSYELATPEPYTTETRTVSFFKASQKSTPSSSTTPQTVQQPANWTDRAKNIFVSTPAKPSKLSGVKKKIREKAVLIRDVLISHNSAAPKVPIKFASVESDPPPYPTGEHQPPPIHHKFVSQQIISIKDIEPTLEWDDGKSVSLAPTVSALPPRIRVALSTLTEESDEEDDDEQNPDDPLVDAVLVRLQNPSGSTITRSRVSPPWMNKALPLSSPSKNLPNVVISEKGRTSASVEFEVNKAESVYPETLVGSEFDDEESVFLVPLRTPTRASVVSSLVDRLSVHSFDQQSISTHYSMSDAGTNFSSRSSAVVMLPYSPLVKPSGLLGHGDASFQYGGVDTSGLGLRRMNKRASNIGELLDRRSIAPSISEFGNPFDADEAQARHSAMLVFRPISPSTVYGATESPRIPAMLLHPFTSPTSNLRPLTPVDHNIRHSQPRRRSSFLLPSPENLERRPSNTSSISYETSKGDTLKHDSKVMKERAMVERRRTSLEDPQRGLKPGTSPKKERTARPNPVLGSTPAAQHTSAEPQRSASPLASRRKKSPKPLTPPQPSQKSGEPSGPRRSSRTSTKISRPNSPTSPTEVASVVPVNNARPRQSRRTSRVRSPSPSSSPAPSVQPLKPLRSPSAHTAARSSTSRKDRPPPESISITTAYLKSTIPSADPSPESPKAVSRTSKTPPNSKSKASSKPPTTQRHFSVSIDKPLPSLPPRSTPSPLPSPGLRQVRRKEPPAMPLGRSTSEIVTSSQQSINSSELGRSRTFHSLQSVQNAEFLESSGKAFAGQPYKCIQVFDANDIQPQVWLDSSKTGRRSEGMLLVPSIMYNRPH